MAEFSPHDPRDGLDLERHPTSCFATFAADRQNASGIQHGVASQLAWLTSHVLHVDVGTAFLLWSWRHGWVGWGACFFPQKAVGPVHRGVGIGAGRVCRVPSSPTCTFVVRPRGDETAGGSTTVLVRALLGVTGL